MEEIEVTWTYAVRVWWGWFWRATLWIIPASFVAGLILGIIFMAIGVDIEAYMWIANLVGGAIGVYFSVAMMKKILSRKFHGFRLALIKTEDV